MNANLIPQNPEELFIDELKANLSVARIDLWVRTIQFYIDTIDPESKNILVSREVFKILSDEDTPEEFIESFLETYANENYSWIEKSIFMLNQSDEYEVIYKFLKILFVYGEEFTLKEDTGLEINYFRQDLKIAERIVNFSQSIETYTIEHILFAGIISDSNNFWLNLVIKISEFTNTSPLNFLEYVFTKDFSEKFSNNRMKCICNLVEITITNSSMELIEPFYSNIPVDQDMLNKKLLIALNIKFFKKFFHSLLENFPELIKEEFGDIDIYEKNDLERFIGVIVEIGNTVSEIEKAIQTLDEIEDRYFFGNEKEEFLEFANTSEYTILINKIKNKILPTLKELQNIIHESISKSRNSQFLYQHIIKFRKVILNDVKNLIEYNYSFFTDFPEDLILVPYIQAQDTHEKDWKDFYLELFKGIFNNHENFTLKNYRFVKSKYGGINEINSILDEHLLSMIDNFDGLKEYNRFEILRILTHIKS